MSEKTKAELLDSLEQNAMTIAGEVAMHKIGYVPNFAVIENTLGGIIDTILELKKIEGVPTLLRKIEALQTPEQ